MNYYISNDEFDDYVNQGIEAIPDKFKDEIKNVAIVIEEYPTPDQMHKGKVRPGGLLFGLYEGIPRTARGNNYSGVIPDKISIFKLPILAVSRSPEDVRDRVKNTVWHEIAHHFGLGHDRIHELENKMNPA